MQPALGLSTFPVVVWLQELADILPGPGVVP